jgi:patatin-like phospholipase/acyl hydrolase
VPPGSEPGIAPARSAWFARLFDRVRGATRRGRPVRVLAIDGGGIRGIIPAAVLADLERRADRRVADLFDLIAGTSTGGIIALALTRPDPDGTAAWRAEEVYGLYEHEGARIFQSHVWQTIRGLHGVTDQKYDASGIEDVLHRYLGDARLSDALTDVLIPSYDVTSREPFFFDSAKARQDPAHDYPMRVAARGTSAAPSYFEPSEMESNRAGGGLVLVDGGLYANNPAMCAFTEVEKSRFGAEVVLVSLGTGSMTRVLPYAEIRNWGLAEWARPILHVVLDGVSTTIDYQLSQLLGPERYWRFQTVLTEAKDDLDNAHPENVRRLQAHAAKLVRDRAADLERVAGVLSR